MGVVSQHQGYTYKIGQPQEKTIELKPGCCEIEEGYHSWKKKEPYGNYLFMIPKDTKYYDGLENGGSAGYVSDNIICLGHYLSLKTWVRALKFL